MAVKLDDVKTIIGDVLTDGIAGGIDEDADTLAFLWQIGRAIADVATGLRIEDKAHHVDA